jgi:DNA-binding transcriptional regulator YiaG
LKKCGLIFEMSPNQCRAARGWLKWSRGHLSARSGVSVSIIREFENGRIAPVRAVTALRATLEIAGIGFAFVYGSGACGITYAIPNAER